MLDDHRVCSWGTPDCPNDLQDVIRNTHSIDRGGSSGARAAKKGGPTRRGSSKKKGGGVGKKSPMARGSGAAAVKNRRAAPSVSSSKSRKTAASRQSAMSKRSSKSRISADEKKKNDSSTPASRKKAGSVSSSRPKSRGLSPRAKGRKKRLTLAAALSTLDEQESESRKVIMADECLERGNYIPIYNVLVMEMVRAQVETLSARQRTMNEMMQALREQGLTMGEGDGIEVVLERLRQKLQSDAVEEATRLRAENMSLRDRIQEIELPLEKKVAEVEVMRRSMARSMARKEVDNENMRAQVQMTLQQATLDVERMKSELRRCIDIATAALRTPKYGTALRSLQSLAQAYQEEVQEHHDRLCHLILMIGAKDTFMKDPSETMHSNLPVRYRVDLRKLNKDHLLNVLDVLSFQEGVVETVGKALFVLNAEEEHHTSVV